jgi:hypothetical protein
MTIFLDFEVVPKTFTFVMFGAMLGESLLSSDFNDLDLEV